MAALNSTSSYAAYYTPWLQAVDPSSQTRGAVKLLPPGAFVAGIIATTDLQHGPFKAPAGLGARLNGVVMAERVLSGTDRDTLNDANINAIRTHPLGGIVVFGARTLTKSTAIRYVNVRRNLIYIKTNIKLLSEFAIFENNDSTTWSLVSQRIAQFLTGWWQAGGLRGDTIDQAFYVVCDETNNTQQTIDAGELHATVGVSLEEPAEFIVIQVGQWQGGQSAVSA
jgi:phage tail sheath protein FI